METGPPLPYEVLNLQYLLSLPLIKDRILKLIFVYDVDALYDALNWVLDWKSRLNTILGSGMTALTFRSSAGL